VLINPIIRTRTRCFRHAYHPTSGSILYIRILGSGVTHKTYEFLFGMLDNGQGLKSNILIGNRILVYLYTK
jgi:hypothetical protein